MIRVKRNPTDHELLKNIKVKKSEHYNDDGSKSFWYEIYSDQKLIGAATITKNKNYIDSISINPYFRRKGLATHIYNYIENDQNIKLKPSYLLLSDGEKFWKNRLKKQNPTDKSLLSKIQIQKTYKNSKK